jgi:hypothetical protein
VSRRGGVPSGAAEFIVMGVFRSSAPINLSTGVQVTHTNQRRAEKMNVSVFINRGLPPDLRVKQNSSVFFDELRVT